MNYIKILRPKQWVKNLLVFVPLIFAGCFKLIPIATSLIGFLSFSLIASCIYIINDIKDYNLDRTNPLKYHRPIANGSVSKKEAGGVCFICFLLAVFTSILCLPFYFNIVLLIYIILNLLYIYKLKNQVVLDVLCLSGSFILRIIAGGFLAGVEVTSWILVTGFFLALFLGFAKRRGEVVQENIIKRETCVEYSLNILDRFIIGSGMLAVICYALFTLDAGVIEKFQSPHLFYTIPFPVYGIFRYIMIIQKKEDTDPTNMLYSDKNIVACIICWLALTLCIMQFHL